MVGTRLLPTFLPNHPRHGSDVQLTALRPFPRNWAARLYLRFQWELIHIDFVPGQHWSQVLAFKNISIKPKWIHKRGDTAEKREWWHHGFGHRGNRWAHGGSCSRAPDELRDHWLDRDGGSGNCAYLRGIATCQRRPAYQVHVSPLTEQGQWTVNDLR